MRPCSDDDVVSASRESYSIGGSRGLCTFIRQSVAKCGEIAVRREASNVTTSRIAHPLTLSRRKVANKDTCLVKKIENSVLKRGPQYSGIS